MTAPATRSEALVLRWAAHYTRDLDRRIAEDRIAELRSDLWEQRADAERSARRSRIGLATSILGRAARGIPSDLAWRRGRLAAGLGERVPVLARWERTGVLALALLVAVALVVGGALATGRLLVDVLRWGIVVHPVAAPTVVVAFIACVVGTAFLVGARRRWLGAMWLAAGSAGLVSAVVPALVATSATMSAAVYGAFGYDSYNIVAGATPWLAAGLAATYLVLALLWIPERRARREPKPSAGDLEVTR